MGSLKKYTKLKQKVEEVKQKANKAAGALEEVMKQLKDIFACTTLKAATLKLVLLQKQEKKLIKEFENVVEKFEEEWEETE